MQYINFYLPLRCKYLEMFDFSVSNAWSAALMFRMVATNAFYAREESRDIGRDVCRTELHSEQQIAHFHWLT